MPASRTYSAEFVRERGVGSGGVIRILAVSLLMLSAGAWAEPDADLSFSISEGRSDNYFIRQGDVSAHLNLRTQPTPRVVVAFPAGNSGVALFFRKAGDGPVWGEVTNMKTIVRSDEQGRTLYGMQVDIDIEAETIDLADADVGSVRFLRGAVDYSKLPPRDKPGMRIDGRLLHVYRERPDGLSSYRVDVEVLAGELQTVDGLRFKADDDGRLKIRITAASGDPLERAANRPLTTGGARNERIENTLAFLTCQTKMLAGSWRFLTYFGRDTLLSLRLLMPILKADTAEIGLGSVLERLSRDGEVAHEEDIGELAVYRNMAERDRATADPIYDYDMVDDNLMLAPVFSQYVETFGPRRAAAFLSGRTSAAQALKSQLVSNLRFVVRQAVAFADDPVRANLIAIKDGFNDGNWRDSEEGLVGGRYPYDVNAVLMPAALRAAADIVGSGVLGDDADSLPGKDAMLKMAGVWETHAATFFRVTVGSTQARAGLIEYASRNGYPLPVLRDHDVSFYAVALDARLEPIPVMHSDVGLDMLFLHRPAEQLAEIITTLAAPFPAGLSTPVGVLAANPVFADAEAQALVTRNHYHGTVVWSWQQAMMIAGLDAQLRRHDLPAALRGQLQAARLAIWNGITASREIINSELWSFTVSGGAYRIAPFGQSEAHLTESNAAQLWSTVFLALRLVTAGQRPNNAEL